MDTEEILFKSDGLTLSGMLHLPDAKKPPVVIGLHGLMADKKSPKQVTLAAACNRLGMAYFRFDHRGCGESEGDFHTVTSLAGRCQDLRSAVQMLRERPDLGTAVGLFGSSFGGTVCMCMGGRIEAGAVVVYGAPLRSRTLFRIPASLSPPGKGPSPEMVKRMSFDISDSLSRLYNILIVHGEYDEVVPLDDAKNAFNLAGSPKQLIVQKGGDHRMTSGSHQEAFMVSASRWLKAGLSPTTNPR